MSTEHEALDLVVVGGLTRDLIVRPHRSRIHQIDGAPMLVLPYGGKVHLDDAEFAYGGGGANVAVVATRAGLRTAVLARVGIDADGRGAREHLRDAGVDVGAIRDDPEAATGFSVVLTGPDGDRTVLVHAGANANLCAADLDPSVLDRTRWLYVSSMRGEAGPLFDELAEWAPATGVRLALNPGATQIARGTSGMRAALRSCDVLLVNDDEARTLLGVPHGDGTSELAARLRELTAGLVVVTYGAEGAVACDVDGRTVAVAALPCPVVCTVGAGDAFGATVVAEVARGASAEDALIAATANAAAVVGRFGAHDGALSRDALDMVLARTADAPVG